MKHELPHEAGYKARKKGWGGRESKKPHSIWNCPLSGTTMAGFRDSGRGAAQPCGRQMSDVGKRKARLTMAGVSPHPLPPELR